VDDIRISLVLSHVVAGRRSPEGVEGNLQKISFPGTARHCLCREHDDVRRQGRCTRLTGDCLPLRGRRSRENHPQSTRRNGIVFWRWVSWLLNLFLFQYFV